MKKRLNILDCTFRDGGYYTNWDFSDSIVKSYLDAINHLPVDYIEIGYRNNPASGYMGRFAYCPISFLQKIRDYTNKKIAVMINEKNTTTDDIESLLGPLTGLIDMVRIAVAPINIDRAILLAKKIKGYGFKIAFNVMYMSQWCEYDKFFDHLTALNSIIDLFVMVDSFGSVTPIEIKETFTEIKKRLDVPIGFHSHNNLQLALINTLTAIETGVEMVDATVLGMGRGAGNLNLELLLTYLNKKDGLEVDLNTLGDLVAAFNPLLLHHQWGTNLPYMISGANSIPQKEVMEWVTNRIYSFNSIVRALNNRKDNIIDNAKFASIDIKRKYDTILVIGGGETVDKHISGIKSFLCLHKNTALIFATCRHASLFEDVINDKYYILIGAESRRLEKTFDKLPENAKVILPPYPRAMGTDVPDFAVNSTYELKNIDFCEKYNDSCTTVALQLAIDLCAPNTYVIGYDGYSGNILSEKEMSLTRENRYIFESYIKNQGAKLKSLTSTLYTELESLSIYQYI